MKRLSIIRIISVFVCALCVVNYSYGQRKETVSQAFHIKIESKKQLVQKLQDDFTIMQMQLQKEFDQKVQDISESVSVSISPTVELEKADDGSDEMNMKVTFSYETKFIDDNIRLKVGNKTDDYPAGAYLTAKSNACTRTCNYIKEKLEGEFAKYIKRGTKITIKITGSTDGTPVGGKIPYYGEYGEYPESELIYVNNVPQSIKLTKATGVTSNAQLAFLRAKGVEYFMDTYIETLEDTKNKYKIYAVENKSVGGQYRRIDVEITIHGAFDDEMQNLPDYQTKKVFDVDTNIPVTNYENKDALVLIIANQNYKNTCVSDVANALNDGKRFREYCIKTLGVPDRQIFYFEDATKNEISEGINKLTNAMDGFGGSAKVIVYYAGHGVPIKTGETIYSYFVPADANPTDRNQMIEVSSFYQKITSHTASDIAFFVDACFTGAKRNGDMMESNTRGIAIKPQISSISGNAVVFSASSSDETAFAFAEGRHGLFTYFILKILNETKGNLTYGELFDSVKDEVAREASLNEKMPSHKQHPTVSVSDNLKAIWRQIKFK